MKYGNGVVFSIDRQYTASVIGSPMGGMTLQMTDA